MPTPAQVDSLVELLDTRTPIVAIETHDERRVMAIFEAVSKRSGRELWTWSVSRGLRVAHGLKLKLMDFDNDEGADARTTQELPAALQQVDRMQEPAIVVFLDVHPFLSKPAITRAMKELALKCEARGLQLAFVGHDIDLPDELAPFTSRFDIEPMNIERVKLLFNEEMARQRSRSGADVSGCGVIQRMLGTLLTWMTERRSSVFLVTTANDIERLPPELMRKGRFNEIFFVDLPDATVREGIFGIHLKQHRVTFDAALMQALVFASDGCSGAEIETAVIAARYEAHATTTPDAALVLAELKRTRPLSVTRAEAIDALRAWAAQRAVSAD